MVESSTAVAIRACCGSDEYAALVEIWRSAVRATHDFLEESDFARIEAHLASDYFPAVTLTVAERFGKAVGFAGVLDGGLEMLFVADVARGEGVGSALLAEVIKNQAVMRVDVNEQNSGGHCFCISKGFAQVGRSVLDGDGRPYPIIHMELQPTPSRIEDELDLVAWEDAKREVASDPEVLTADDISAKYL